MKLIKNILDIINKTKNNIEKKSKEKPEKSGDSTIVSTDSEELKNDRQPNNDAEADEESTEIEAELLLIRNKVDIARKLAETLGTTLNMDEFNSTLSELKGILRELIAFEKRYKFDVLPSKDLEYLEKSEKKQMEFLERRIEESKKTKEEIKEADSEIVSGQQTGTLPILEKITECAEVADKDEAITYASKRMIIKGVHFYFIDIAREIVQQKRINAIPLMREYRISEKELNEIIIQIQDAKILDSNKAVSMTEEEFERFIDIYEPSIFECENSIFDKEIFMVMGEIIFDNGVRDTYNSLPADEVIDYLNIMENLKIISYDNYKNEYNILVSKEEFDRICGCIPDSFSNTNYEDPDTDYSNVDFDNMSGIEFEKYCAYILSKNGFCGIKITPPSGDHGIDVLAEKDGITYAIQCKCYSDNIGNAAVQQAHTGKSLYHKDIAVVMTNRYFTTQAIEEAKELGVKLWDRDKLNEMICNG